jgi:uncharacterized tellurite resistance protein B-like protein
MLDRILSLLASNSAGVSLVRDDEAQIAVAALFVEAARMDERFDAAERGTIERLLASRFDLSAGEARELLGQAERAADRSSQLFGFTETIARRFDPGERVRMIEMLWEIAYADGVLSAQEDALIRRIAGLIYVPDSDRMGARQRVRQRLGVND